MSNTEIAAYYKTIDNLIDRENNKTIYLDSIDDELYTRIITERSDKTKYFSNTLYFYYKGISHVWDRSPVKPDGYVDFTNYWYRHEYSSPQKKYYVQYYSDE